MGLYVGLEELIGPQWIWRMRDLKEKEKCDQFDLILSLVMTAGRLEFKLSSGNPFRKRQHWLHRPPIQSYEEFVILLHNPSILFSLHLTTGAAVFSKVEGFISSFPALL